MAGGSSSCYKSDSVVRTRLEVGGVADSLMWDNGFSYSQKLRVVECSFGSVGLERVMYYTLSSEPRSNHFVILMESTDKKKKKIKITSASSAVLKSKIITEWDGRESLLFTLPIQAKVCRPWLYTRMSCMEKVAKLLLKICQFHFAMQRKFEPLKYTTHKCESC